VNRMIRVKDIARVWFRAGLGITCLAALCLPLGAQTQGKTPAKPPANGSSQEKEDPLAPLLQRGNEAIDKMDFAAALDPLQKYIAQRPDDPFAHFQLGYAFVGLKRPEDAKTQFQRAIALDPKMGAAHLNLGLLLMASDPAAAAEAFRHAADLQPTESHTRFLAGYCLEQTGKMPEAVEQYRAALAISPKDYEAHYALGRVLIVTKDAAGAEEQFRQAVAARSDSAEARLSLANTLLVEGKRGEGSAALAEYLKLKPADRAAHYDRASAFFELGKFDDAVAELDLFETGAEGTPDSLKMRADIYMDQKKWKEAEGVLIRANQLSPTDPDVAEWMGRTQIELHNYPAAIRILAQVYQQNPQSVDALRDLANVFVLNESYASALEAMDRLAKLESPKPGSWFVRAICYDKLSRKAEAIGAYQKFLDQDGGQHDTQDFQARQRILALQHEQGQPEKK
jgi:tetratricopeptide (TPR) repeat protein